MVQGIQHAGLPPARNTHGGHGSAKEGHVSKKEGPSIPGGPREHEGQELTVDERKALHQEKEQVRISEAAAHREVRAHNMEAGLKPSKRAKKEARAAEKKRAKEQGEEYDGTHGESGDEDDDEDDE